tara:strand:+ start:5072 stop:8263 length:3192 start_codon:yes stop_codon:yes gene_type:complete
MSETIIIESNRQIAYKQERKNLTGVNERNANVNLPNNAWKTRLESGIVCEVGTEIAVEAVMVNTRGSPEETIEFSGIANVQDTDEVLDNKVDIKFQKYITNRQQFNANLPFHNTYLQQINSQAGNYGYVSFADFQLFKNHFPYRGIEGMYVTSEATDGTLSYAEVKGEGGILDGVFTKPPAPVDDADPTRYFLGNDEFIGYMNILNSPDRGAWNFATTDVTLEVATGFNTPSKIGESLTAQLHQRQGIASDWQEQAVDTNIYQLRGTAPNAKFVSVANAGITDQSYQSVPTSTGDIFRARSEVGTPPQATNWSAKIAGEGADSVPEGTGYTEEQGRDIFHRNMLCGNPYEYRGVYAWLVGRINGVSSENILLKPDGSAQNFEELGLYTGHTNLDSASPKVGQYGLNTVLMDELDHETVTYAPTAKYKYNNNIQVSPLITRYAGIGEVENMDFMKCNKNTLIVTNNFYNQKNVDYFKVAWLENEIPVNHIDQNLNANPLTQNLTKQFFQQLYYGRADDQKSCGATGTKINLTNTNEYLTSSTTLNSYQTIERDAGEPITAKKALVRQAGLGAWNDRNYINCWSRYDPFFDQTKAGKVNFVFPTASKFTLTDSLGNYHSQFFSELAGLAIVPVFYKQSELVGAGLGGTIPDIMKDLPFIAFVTYENININQEQPAPMEGEFFGRSPAFYDNLLAKVVNTQKVFQEASKIPPSQSVIETYPVGDNFLNTRTYQYMPYCMIGADNPTIQFDDTYGRFTISSLHTAVRTGNGVFQAPLSDANEQASQNSMCAWSRESAICGTEGGNAEKISYTGIVQSSSNNPLISSQSGLAIQDIFLYTKTGILPNSLDPRTPIIYEGTLFNKLGFELEQLLPYVGQRQSAFNRGTFGQYLGKDQTFVNKYNTMVAPVTTNAYISGADQLSIVENNARQQMSNLGGTAFNQSVFINAVSDDLIAVNLPSKLDYSYLIVYSNIVPNTQFYGGANGQQKIPAMAYVSRNYSTGDFFFGQETSWSYIVDKEFILTEFDVNITLPNGLPAPIEDNSSIIYKITKPKTLPPPQSAFLPQKKK